MCVSVCMLERKCLLYVCMLQPLSLKTKIVFKVIKKWRIQKITIVNSKPENNKPKNSKRKLVSIHDISRYGITKKYFTKKISLLTFDWADLQGNN